MNMADLPVILGPVVGGALFWIGHAIVIWLRHRHGAP